MMIRTISSLVLALLLASPSTAQNYTLVWSDEFDYTGLPDEAKWNYDVGGGGWGNNELQYYTEADLDNASVADGVLTITARREDVGGRSYTSARLNTRGMGEWTYGRFEIRAKLPAGVGTWPAIWMLYAQGTYGNGSWPDNGEIDIMEHVGFDPGVVHATVHTNAFNHQIGTQRGSEITVSDFDTAFHDYVLEWTPRQLRAYVDDDLYFTFDNTGGDWTEWPYNHPMFLILNIAIGGDWGGQQGVNDAIFPVSMEVDYVRVYQDLDAEPTVSLTTPTLGQDFEAGAAISLAGTVSDVAPGVERIELLQDEGVLRTLDAEDDAFLSSFDETVLNAQPGCYQIRVRAIDGDGYETTTDPTAITVGDAATCPQAPYLIAAHPVGLTDLDEVEAEYYDLGGDDVAYSDFTDANTGVGGIRTGEGVDIEPAQTAGGGYNVTSITRREWLEYTLDVQRAGRYTVDVFVAAGGSGGTFALSIDGEDLVDPTSFDATGGLQRWSIVRLRDIVLEEGIHVLRFTAQTTGFNLDKFAFRFSGTVAAEDEATPVAFGFVSAYPNPARDETSLTYRLSAAGPTTLAVHDVTGRRVASLVDGFQTAQTHTVLFATSELPSGVYLVVLQSPSGRDVQRIVVTR